jgi:DNA-binding NtrC family response regulator
MATTPGIERTVLVVDPSVERVRETVAFLQAAGYSAIGATSFDAARNLLATPPDVLISELRLRSFNGLHLVLHGRLLKPDMVAIVVADNLDAFLAAEAARRGVAYLVRPLDSGALLALMSAGLEQRPVEGARPEDFMALYRERRITDRRLGATAVPGERRVADRRHAAVANSRRVN